jgi:hypothetical protein
MPLRPTLLERLLARLNLVPTPLFDAMLAPGITRALLTACEMGLFDALSARPLTLAALAARVKSEPEGLRLLLDILVSAGYVHRRGELYRNSRAAQRWLTSSSPVSIKPYILHSPDLVAFWEYMPQVVRENRLAVTMPYEQNASSPAMQELLARHYAGLAVLAHASRPSAVEYRPADVVSQPLIVQDKIANRIRQLVTLPAALESAGTLALAFRRSRACGLDRVSCGAELVRGDVRDYRCLTGSIRGMARRPSQVPGRGHCMAAGCTGLGHRDLAACPCPSLLNCVTRPRVRRLLRLEEVQDVLRTRRRPRGEKVMV